MAPAVPPRSSGWRLRLLCLAALAIAAGAGCAGTGGTLPTLESGRFVECGEAKPDLPPPQHRRLEHAWNRWADANLRTGDVVFRRGTWRVFGGVWDVTKYTAKIADSNFTHAGIVEIDEHGRAYVYDTTIGPGPARTRFHEFVLDQGLCFGVKRLRPEYADAIPAAMAYVKQVYDERRPFDPRFTEGEDKLYCTELIELAYRHAGVKLSDPVAYCDFPHFGRYPLQNTIAWAASGWSPKHEVLLPGNEDVGMWASDKFEYVFAANSPYDPEAVSALPPVPAAEAIPGYVSIRDENPEAATTQSYLRAVR